MDIYDLIGKGKIKRYLSARNKIIYPGGIYHVTHRAPGRERVFLEKGDYLRMLFLLKETSKEFIWDIFSFALMPNHLHILLRITDANLSKGVKKMCERYAKYFNKKYERKGPVFSRPYRAALCLDEAYLLCISLYIHLNPFKAGICKNIEDYKWSSFGLYAKDDKKSFIKSKFVLDMLGSNIDESRNRYLELIAEFANFQYKNIIETPSWIENLKNHLKNFKKKTGFQEDDLEQQVEEYNKSKLNNPQDTLGKRYLIEQLQARGFSITAIANKLGVSRMTVYRILGREDKKHFLKKLSKKEASKSIFKSINVTK